MQILKYLFIRPWLAILGIGLCTALAPSHAMGQTTYNLNIIFKTGSPDTSLYRWGAAISGVGDVNGDAYDDVAVGAYRFVDGQDDTAKIYIYIGSASIDSMPDLIISDWSGGTNGLHICGGNINGDAFSDLVVVTGGKVYMHYGSSAGPSVIPDIAFGGRLYEGYKTAATGDLNDDDTTDLIVSDFWNMGGSGHVNIYKGSAAYDTIPWLTLKGHDYEQFGSAVVSGADLNGDGIQDLVVGAQTYNTDSRGRVYVFHGGPAMDTIPDWWKDGTPGEQNFGSSWWTAIVKTDTGCGKVWACENWYPGGYWSTKNNGLTWLFLGGSTMDTIPDMTIQGQDTISLFGSSAASSLMDSGGVGDMLCGSYGNDISIGIGEGLLWLSQNPQDTITDAWIRGRWSGDKLGAGLANAGDVNNDGKEEAIFASYDTNRIVVICKYTGPNGVEQGTNNGEQIMGIRLDKNYPNPFSHQTTIKYQILKSGRTSLKLYNVAGQLVRVLVDEAMKSGSHEVRWDGRNGKSQKVTNGIYFYQLNTGGQRMTRKMQLIR